LPVSRAGEQGVRTAVTLNVGNKHCCIMFWIKQYQQRHTREGVERYREEGGHYCKMLHNDW